MLKSLNEQQKKAVLSTEGPLLILAGAGSGKTKVLVHKLASLLLLEDVKHEQLLMLTFSRAAAIEFKQRLRELIGNAANFIEIKTFHSYCFDLLGKIGNIQESENVVQDAGRLLLGEDVDRGKITKTVLVIDEAQDMDIDEYRLVETLMNLNDDMRVIAVGDDDQNIYQFRGSDSKYFRSFINKYGAKQYSLIENYRSSFNVIKFANRFAKDISNRMKAEDIRAVRDMVGEVKLIKHNCENLEVAVVSDVISENLKGSTCILTNTNEEALLILGIFKQKGIPAKLIQSMDGFDIYDIAEIRFFLNILIKKCNSPVISIDIWNDAVKLLEMRYRESTCLPIIKKILDLFQQSNEKMYRSDFEIFLHESGLEDFYTQEQGIVTISTMHKSKGREFDNVYMLLNKCSASNDEQKRKLYVGMTRAKDNLHIHYNGDYLDKYAMFASKSVFDKRVFMKPSELIIQLNHRDVFLDFFKDKQSIIAKLKSGDHLDVYNNRLCIKENGRMVPVLQFSSKCNEAVRRITDAGFVPYDSTVRFICAWKVKEENAEIGVILADIYFRRTEI